MDEENSLDQELNQKQEFTQRLVWEVYGWRLVIIIVFFLLPITLVIFFFLRQFILGTKISIEHPLMSTDKINCHIMPTVSPKKNWQLETSKSPNGKIILTLTRKEDTKPVPGSSEVNGIINTIAISDINGSNKKIVYSEVTGPVSEIDLPEKPWSPDSKYFYLILSTVDFHNLYLFKSDGNKFGNQMFLDLNEIMRKNYPFGPNEIISWGKDSIILSSYDYIITGPNYKFDIADKLFTVILSKNDAETKQDVEVITQEVKNFYNKNCFLPSSLDSAAGPGEYYFFKKNPNNHERYQYVLGDDHKSFMVSGRLSDGTSYKLVTSVN